MWRSTRCYGSDPGWISGCEPVVRPGSGRARATSRHVRTPAAPEPKDLGAVEVVATAYAEVVVWGDVQRRGGARERRGSVAMRRRWVRIRSIARGWVMKATMRISCPHRGHRSGSTSKIRRSRSAQRRRVSGSEGGTNSASTAGGCSWAPALRRMPRVRLAH